MIQPWSTNFIDIRPRPVTFPFAQPGRILRCKFTKDCACEKKWHSNFTKYYACHGKCKFNDILLHSTTFYDALLHSFLLHSITFHSNTFYCGVLHSIGVHSATFYHILLHSNSVYFILLHSATFYHILPHCILHSMFMIHERIGCFPTRLPLTLYIYIYTYVYIYIRKLCYDVWCIYCIY